MNSVGREVFARNPIQETVLNFHDGRDAEVHEPCKFARMEAPEALGMFRVAEDAASRI
jgi:hypothetical protein